MTSVGSPIMSGSASERTDSCLARRRKKSSAALWAIRKSQPSGLTNRPAVGERLDGFDERFLQNVLAIDNRACHARAIAMQLRPQLGDKLVERAATGCVSHATSRSCRRRVASLDCGGIHAALLDAPLKGLKRGKVGKLDSRCRPP